MTYEMQVLKPRQLTNGFTWAPLHYSHDPEKTPEWAMKMRSAFPRPTDWDKEMEINFALHMGTPAYPQYSNAKHLGPVIYDPRRPLYVGMDFNANPMSMIVDQVHESIKQIHVLKALVYQAKIDDIVSDFRGLFNEHRSDVYIYGDSTSGMNAQTAQGNWNVVRLAFRGYHVDPVFRIPPSNPGIGNRLTAVNRILSDLGPYRVVINDEGDCEELARDLREVILTPDGKKIKKVTDAEDPYYFRTHASDAWGYRIFFEFPTVREMVADLSKKRKPMEPGALLGQIDSGLKWREDQRKLEKKRAPLDKSSTR